MAKINRESFTLIELLVVIAVISLVGAIVLVSLTAAKARARDAHRMIEINQFLKVLTICFAEQGDYPDSDLDPGLDEIWDAHGTGWKYGSSCGPCHGNFENAIRPCTTAEVKDPINEGELAYYYFYFEPDATTYNGVPISDECKGRYALMAHLESSTYEKAICFDEPDKYEYWMVLY